MPFEQVARDLVDEGLGVVEDEAALAAARPAAPLVALVEGEVVAVAAQPLLVDGAELEGERQRRGRRLGGGHGRLRDGGDHAVSGGGEGVGVGGTGQPETND